MSDFSKEIEKFNASIDGSANLSYIVRDSELQRAALLELSALAAEVESWKKRAIAEGDENHANIFLGCECSIEALRAELQMWLQLKAGKADDAWNDLVVAQQATRDAVRAHEGFSHLQARAIRLINIERVVFPMQVFFSAGMIAGRQQCSICGEEYGDCPHVVGRPYMGEFCAVRLGDIQADHVALVKEPANKQCRVVSFKVESGMRNRMTWRVELDPRSNPATDEKGLLVQGIILSTSDVGAKRVAREGGGFTESAGPTASRPEPQGTLEEIAKTVIGRPLVKSG